MQWVIAYPGADGIPNTGDDWNTTRDLELPANRKVQIVLSSRDLLYSFGIEPFGIHELAVPGQEVQLVVFTGGAGEFRLDGDQLCGFAHEELIGRVRVLPSCRFDRWYQDRCLR